MNQELTRRAFDILAERFPRYNWQLHDVPGTGGKDSQWHWLGTDEEEIMICVYRGTYLQEPFHRQDFFYFNYAWKGSFQAIGQTRQNLITVNESDLIAGQPFTGYALRVDAPEDVEIVGVLVRKDVFFRELLPILSKSSRLLHFFLEPESERFSNELLHLRAQENAPYRNLAEMMAVEYALGKSESQAVLRALTLTLATCTARQYEEDNPREAEQGGADEIAAYIADHVDTASLKTVADAFGYHPNYLSSLIKRETGRTFSQILLESRMRRANLFLQNTTLSVEEISAMLGYASPSNFYKAYRGYFGHSPRATQDAVLLEK